MRKLPAAVVAAIGAASLAGAAFAAAPHTASPRAASPQTHVMNVPLPDGASVRVEYVGDVAPKVSIAPGVAAAAPWAAPMALPLPAFADFDRMIADMNRRSQEMIRQAQQMARQPAGAAPYVAAFGNAPAGQSSTTVVSVSNGGKTCTRTTQVVSQGPGKAPMVTSNARGDCESSPAASGAPVNRT